MVITWGLWYGTNCEAYVWTDLTVLDEAGWLWLVMVISGRDKTLFKQFMSQRHVQFRSCLHTIFRQLKSHHVKFRSCLHTIFRQFTSHHMQFKSFLNTMCSLSQVSTSFPVRITFQHHLHNNMKAFMVSCVIFGIFS